MRARLLFLPFCAALILSACNESQKKQSDAIQEDLKNQIRELTKTAKESATKVDLNLSVDEVKKLFRFEYGVFSLPLSSSAEDLTKELAKLGGERWDCFHVDQKVTEAGGEYLIFCKRHPESVLHYLPKGLLGGIFGLIN